ncbi:MAG: U32 family peptidase, partial [Bacilli bacterium]
MELIVTPFTIEDFSPLSAADAYLIGNDNYGVRLAASFNLDGFEACVSKAHNLGKRLYVNVNKVFTQSEIQSVTPFLEYLKEIEVDGIFFSDFGVYTIAKRIGIANLLIYNSETQLVNPLDVEFMNSLGLQGQLISKDVTLKDIQAI